MDISKYIHINIFIISLAIGLFFVYITGADIHPIYVYPTPQNAGKIQYKDKADNCFMYSAEEITCPDDKSLIAPNPIQR